MIIVSACLTGFPCRWNGESRFSEEAADLIGRGFAIPVCPEQLGGLTTPREPAEIRDSRAMSRTGEDLTSYFQKGAQIVLEIARKYRCETAVLKEHSPSCGVHEIHDGSFSGKLVRGSGITAKLLSENGLQILTENDLPQDFCKFKDGESHGK